MMELEPGRPCGFCAVRSDVDCRHRPGIPKLAPPPPRTDKRIAAAKVRAARTNWKRA